MKANTCTKCGSRLRKVHVTFWERFQYSAIYECRRCEVESFVTRQYILNYQRWTLNRRTRQRKPPLNAEFLFHLFMPSPQSADALVGDLEERYRYLRKRFGARRANFWYWWQTLISLRPVMAAALKRVSGVMALIEAYRRMRG
jgi:hypothetical protein